MGDNMKTNDVPIEAKVTFRIADRPIVGRVLEDRGPIGKGGRHLYLVRYELGKGNWHSIELPADEIDDLPDWIGTPVVHHLDVPGLDAERHLVEMSPVN